MDSVKIETKQIIRIDYLMIEKDDAFSTCIEINEETALLIIEELSRYLLDKRKKN